MPRSTRPLAHLARPGTLSDWLDWPETWPVPPFGEVVRSLRPDAIRVEEYVEDHTLVIRAELPGIDPDKDVSITLSDGTLQIEAERRSSQTAETARGYRSEFRYGSFSRVIPLPEGVRDEDVAATYRDGILEVRVPVPQEKEESKPRTVPVRHS